MIDRHAVSSQVVGLENQIENLLLQAEAYRQHIAELDALLEKLEDAAVARDWDRIDAALVDFFEAHK